MRPAVFQVGGTLYWTLLTRNPDTMVLKDADSTPTVGVGKRGSYGGDSVTITKRSATTGIYDCSYNPAGEVEGDAFTLEESATVTGTTTSSATYNFAWNVRCVAVERGTDSAALASGVNVTQLGGDAQSLADLKDFADAGYDPTANAVTAVLDSAARVKLDASQPDYAPATASALATVYALLQLTDTDVASILTTVGTIETKIGTPATSLAAMIADVPTVSEFEARTIAAASYRQNISLRGSGMTEAKAIDLLLASLAGVTSQPSGTTEKFKFLDGNDAFTTTFDTNGNRTGVSLA